MREVGKSKGVEELLILQCPNSSTSLDCHCSLQVARHQIMSRAYEIKINRRPLSRLLDCKNASWHEDKQAFFKRF